MRYIFFDSCSSCLLNLALALIALSLRPFGSFTTGGAIQEEEPGISNNRIV